MVWMVLGVAFLFVVINRYSVRERTQQFAILKVLGASSTFIFELLFHETMIIAVAGTIAGIVVAYGGTWLIAFALPDLFVMQVAYEWRLLAGMISAAGFLFVGSLAAWMATRQDLIQALSYDE
jgi:ABC-type antimicrobial peptide transport system permease subunit